MLTPDRCTECDLVPGPCTSCQLRTALADVEAMRAAVDAGREIAEYEDCGQQCCGFCDHPLPDCSGVCCPGSRLRAALRALDARERDARATPSGGKGRE